MRSQWHTGMCVCAYAQKHTTLCHLHTSSASSGSLCYQTVYMQYVHKMLH